jgi:hypothetical protein
MRRTLLSVAAGIAILAAGQIGWALNPETAGGMGGIGRRSEVTAGWGRASDDGLARPGFPSRTQAGQIGVSSAGCAGSLNPGTGSDFHVAGMGKVITAGIGRSTMETVPGRSPTYINIVVGTRMAPYMGSRGP